MEMPMLDESEWEALVALRTEANRGIKEYRKSRGVGLKEVPRSFLDAYFEPLLAEYERITGYRETNPNAIWHHRIAIYGPPCDDCAKPLRTPKAKLCAACGWRVPVDRLPSGPE
jgi:hypothetical protein